MELAKLIELLRDPGDLKSVSETYSLGEINAFIWSRTNFSETEDEKNEENIHLRDYRRCQTYSLLNNHNCRVMALITAYEDPEAVAKCVDRLQKQYIPVELILIVDNSSKKKIDPQAYDKDTVTVISKPENIGISGSLWIGFKWAIEKGFDFIWTFDQDSEVMPDVLGKLLLTHQKLSHQEEKIGIVSPTLYDPRYGFIYHGSNLNGDSFSPPLELIQDANTYYRCDFVFTSGSLFNLRQAGMDSLPNVDLFIDAVDIEHCMNIRKQGASIVVDKSSIMIHSLGERKTVRTFPFGRKKDIFLLTYSPLRQYFLSRNTLLVMLKIIKPESRFLYLLRHLFRTTDILFMCLFYIGEKKFIKMWAIVLGKIHGIQGKINYRWK